MKENKFTIIIATHKRPILLERSIKSVQNQTLKAHQIIVVSDTVCKDTIESAKKLLRENDLFVQRYNQPGPSKSRNTAINLAEGDYLIFLDDDDTFEATYLQDLNRMMHLHNNKSNIYYTDFGMIDDSDNNPIQRMKIGDLHKDELFVKNKIPNNCLVYPTEIARKYTFDTTIAYEDWDYLLSCISMQELIYIPIYGPLVHKISANERPSRGHKNNNSNDLLLCYLNTYKKHKNVSDNVKKMRADFFSQIGIDINSLLI